MSEELKLLPCPACGECDVKIDFSAFNGKFLGNYVRCDMCGVRGPLYDTPEDALKYWNVLPRALTWTASPMPGWNAWRKDCESAPMLRFVLPNGMLTSEKSVGLTTWIDIGGQWCPIPMPKEPTP